MARHLKLIEVLKETAFVINIYSNYNRVHSLQVIRRVPNSAEPGFGVVTWVECWTGRNSHSIPSLFGCERRRIVVCDILVLVTGLLDTVLNRVRIRRHKSFVSLGSLEEEVVRLNDGRRLSGIEARCQRSGRLASVKKET